MISQKNYGINNIMKKIFFTLMLLISPCYCTQMPQNIDEYLNKPYIGMSYNEALNQKVPFLLIFANPNNLISVAKLAPIGEMVYNDFKGEYNFCIINTKIKENENLMDFFNPQKLPALYIIDTQEKTYTLIEKKYYTKKSINRILTEFKNGTLF